MVWRRCSSVCFDVNDSLSLPLVSRSLNNRISFRDESYRYSVFLRVSLLSEVHANEQHIISLTASVTSVYRQNRQKLYNNKLHKITQLSVCLLFVILYLFIVL